MQSAWNRALMMEIRFKAPLWMWNGKGAWYFVTLPVEEAAKMRFFASESFAGAKKPKGWGSVRVKLLVGKTVWESALFPDSKSGSFLLPIKASVRRAENLMAGSMVDIVVTYRSL
jgi:Domain of unknown function (DUF1905)